MRLAAATWSVLLGLLGPEPLHARSAPELEGSATGDQGAPLWSICKSFAQPAGRTVQDGSHDERHGRGTIKIRLPRSPEPAVLETLSDHGPEAPVSWANCVPWGPGITGASSGSLMSASDRDDDEIPICLEGAQCSPVSAKRPVASATFSAAKAMIPFEASPCGPWILLSLPGEVSGDPLSGYPLAPFEPPRAFARA